MQPAGNREIASLGSGSFNRLSCFIDYSTADVIQTVTEFCDQREQACRDTRDPGFSRVCDGLVILRIRAASGFTGHMIVPVQYAAGPKERARGAKTITHESGLLKNTRALFRRPADYAQGNLREKE